MFKSLARGHVEDFGNIAVAVGNLQNGPMIPFPVALRAARKDVGRELHVRLNEPFALTDAAAAPVDVEAEIARVVAALFRFGRFRVKIADIVEYLKVRYRIRTRRAADRRLVDERDLVEILVTENARVRKPVGDRFFVAAKFRAQRRVKRFLNERALARAAHARYHAKPVEREFDVQIFEIVAGRPFERNVRPLRHAAVRKTAPDAPAGKVTARKGIGRVFDTFDRTLVNDLPPVFARAGTEFDDLVGRAQYRLFVIDDDDRIAAIAQSAN